MSNAALDIDTFRVLHDDPVAFVRHVIGAEPDPQQMEILEAIAPEGAHVSIRSGHGTGKSTTLAWVILWFICTRADCKIPVTAPTAHQLSDVIWAELHKWHRQMIPWFRNQVEIIDSEVRIKGVKNQIAVARTARRENPDALQGFHATNLLFVVDEASGVHEKVYEVAEGALSTSGSRVILAGNPTQTTGYFHASHHKHRDHWHRIALSCEASIRPGMAEYCQRMREKYGADDDIYRVRVLGEFPNASVLQLIPNDVVDEAAGRKAGAMPHNPNAPVIIGCDPAWQGDDRSAIFMRQGLRSAILGVYRKMDNMTLASLVAQFEDQHKADAVFIDMGWGAGVIDRLRQLGRNPIPINFGGKAIKTEEFANKRTEMWCLMADWLREGGVIPDVSDLRDDLTAPEYFFTSTGKKCLESKDDMRSRGLPSPDLADALALTFAEPVVKRDDREAIRMYRGAEVEPEDYHPF